MFKTSLATENAKITTKQGVKVIVPKSYPFWEKSLILGGMKSGVSLYKLKVISIFLQINCLLRDGKNFKVYFIAYRV